VTGSGSGGTGGSCAQMIPGSNVSVSYGGGSTNCRPGGPDCQTGEGVTFTLAKNGYILTCAPHTYLWNFGDGSPTSSAESPLHIYTAGGEFQATLKLNNGSQEVTLTRTVKVAGTNNCPAMLPDQNVHLQFFGQDSHCSTSGDKNCQEGEAIAFAVNAVGYNFGCASHTYRWDFGDGTPTSTEQNPSHVYAKKGSYTVTLKIANSKEEVTLTHKIPMAATKARAARH